MANSFNDLFSSVSQNLADRIVPIDESPLNFQAMLEIFNIELVSAEQVEEYILNLKSSTSCGVNVALPICSKQRAQVYIQSYNTCATLVFQRKLSQMPGKQDA